MTKHPAMPFQITAGFVGTADSHNSLCEQHDVSDRDLLSKQVDHCTPSGSVNHDAGHSAKAMQLGGRVPAADIHARVETNLLTGEGSGVIDSAIRYQRAPLRQRPRKRA